MPYVSFQSLEAFSNFLTLPSVGEQNKNTRKVVVMLPRFWARFIHSLYPSWAVSVFALFTSSKASTKIELKRPRKERDPLKQLLKGLFNASVLRENCSQLNFKDRIQRRAF